MSDILYDKDGSFFHLHDPQDKQTWCKIGEAGERRFVEKYGQKLGYIINPKKREDEMAPDLLSIKDNVLADLKVQETPFFTARRYGIDPTYAVVFNLKDERRYAELYPDIDILFYVSWQILEKTIKGRLYTVENFNGIFKIKFKVLQKLLSTAKIHPYENRQNDQLGNARNSYVLDIRDPLFQLMIK